mmetsp:Transcript_20114/g.45393  ORF Transcript_20114/g.45393 Transcript_20114/m.45393 type:complete len:203 (+) Transcript_20114:528-1136(+)
MPRVEQRGGNLCSLAHLTKTMSRQFFSADDDDTRKRPVVMVRSHPNNIPSHVNVGEETGENFSVGESLTQGNLASTMGSPKSSRLDLVAYKIVDSDGNTYVIRAGKTIQSIIKALEGKVSDFEPSTTIFKYEDEDGDEILVKSDECVEEAARASSTAGNKNVKLMMKRQVGGSGSNALFLAAGGAGLAAALAIACAVLMKKK